MFCGTLLYVLSSFAIILFVFLVSCDSYVALSNGAVGWYEVCDCGSSWLYSLAFLY